MLQQLHSIIMSYPAEVQISALVLCIIGVWAVSHVVQASNF